MNRQSADGFGENLIFLISQPRSGSTLLQHILAGHPRIHTLPEPWFMLHLLYANRPSGIAAEYDARTAHRAFSHFLTSLEAQEQNFLDAIRAAAGYLYGQALKGSSADLFLDKSPRYYFIAEGLRDVFPRARIIFLLRNPVAVLSSILHTHAGGDWTALRRLDRMHDLLTAPRCIVRAIDRMGTNRIAVVRYEELVNESDKVLAELARRLEIEDVPNLRNYAANPAPLGDAKTAIHNVPVTTYVHQWKADLDSPAKRQVARSYLQELGPDLVHRLGYDYDELIGQFGSEARRTGRSRWSMLVTPDELLPWWQRIKLGLEHSRHQRGLTKTLIRVAYIAIRGHAWVPPGPHDHIDRRPV